jgi:hypothetical protein
MFFKGLGNRAAMQGPFFAPTFDGLLTSAGRSFCNSQSGDPNLLLDVALQIRLPE